MRAVSEAGEVLDNIRRLAPEFEQNPRFAGRLGQAHAFYVDDRNPDRPLFGFSKAVGYVGLDAKTYLKNAKVLDGRNTEWILKDFFDEVRPGSPDYRRLHGQLSDWLAMFGKTPRKGVRLMVVKPEHRPRNAADPDADRRLLDLMIAVADLLPTDQRHELRARL